MTSLPSATSSLRAARSRAGASRSDAELRRALTTRRPLVPTAVAGGAAAAGATLLVCMAIAVVGWFLTDGGGAGTPSGALRVGALGWLAAHGSGVTVEGVRLTAVPLGMTLLCAWSTWRLGHRVGESVSGHGPDADRIADGERDWTVAVAGSLFVLGYLVVAIVTGALATTHTTQPATGQVVAWSVAVAGLAGVPAIARGSGRAAIWLPAVPSALRTSLRVARSVLLGWLAVSLLTVVVAFALDFATAANIVSQLHAGAGGTFLLTLLSLLVLPNATLFSSSYLLGPGFAVGAGTTVSPAAVVLGPLPMFPLLAALPDAGTQPGWTMLLLGVPVLVAAIAAALVQRSEAPRWDRAALRGCGGGLIAGLVLGCLTAVAGGAVGPGRMAEVGPPAFDALLHALTAFGVGGLLGALAMVAWQRRSDLVGAVRRG